VADAPGRRQTPSCCATVAVVSRLRSGSGQLLNLCDCSTTESGRQAMGEQAGVREAFTWPPVIDRSMALYLKCWQSG